MAEELRTSSEGRQPMKLRQFHLPLYSHIFEGIGLAVSVGGNSMKSVSLYTLSLEAGDYKGAFNSTCNQRRAPLLEG